jgi:hypothetical protein
MKFSDGRQAERRVMSSGRSIRSVTSEDRFRASPGQERVRQGIGSRRPLSVRPTRDIRYGGFSHLDWQYASVYYMTVILTSTSVDEPPIRATASGSQGDRRIPGLK